MANFRSWRCAVRDEVSAASGRGDVAFRWIQEVEQPDATLERLADSGRHFVTLDHKLKSAIQRVTRDEIGRQITQASDDEAKNGRLLKGRQALLIVYKYYEINDCLGVIYNTRDLMAVTWRGDNQMEAFMQIWTNVLSGMKDAPAADTVEELFLEQVRQSKVLKEEVAHYERCAKDHADHSYKFLTDAVRRHIAKTRQRTNRAEMQKSLGGSGSAAAPGPASQPSKASCRFFLQGDCTRGKACPFPHVRIPGSQSAAAPSAGAASGGAGGGRGSGKGKGRKGGKSRGRGKGGKGNSPSPSRSPSPGAGGGKCFNFQRGTCKLGDACRYRHEKMTAEEQRQDRQRSNSRGRSPSPGKRPPVCRMFAESGRCEYGDNCRFEHVSRGRSPERKGKGRGRGAANKQGDRSPAP
jgi:hypothetical protein